MNVWLWLNTNSGALQSIAALLVAVLTAATICVLFVTWRSIQRQVIASELQADAARALTKVAIEQTNAAKDAADATKRQADLLASQLELNTAPLLVCEHATNVVGLLVVNRGLGVAFRVRYWQGELVITHDLMDLVTVAQPSTLAPGAKTELRLPGHWDNWTISYVGSDRLERRTIGYRDPKKPQEHYIRRGSEDILLS